MDTPNLQALIFITLGGALTVLIGLLAWIGGRVHTKLDNLTDKMDAGLKEMNQTLTSIERDLRGELATLDRRVTRMEETIPPGLKLMTRD